MRPRRPIGWLLARPDRVDQPLDRHHLARVDHERGEQPPLAGTTEGTSAAFMSRSSTGPSTWISMTAPRPLAGQRHPEPTKSALQSRRGSSADER